MVATTEFLWNPWTPLLASRRIFSIVSRSMSGIGPTSPREIKAKASRTLTPNGLIQTIRLRTLLAHHQRALFCGDLVVHILPHTRKNYPVLHHYLCLGHLIIFDYDVMPARAHSSSHQYIIIRSSSLDEVDDFSPDYMPPFLAPRPGKYPRAALPHEYPVESSITSWPTTPDPLNRGHYHFRNVKQYLSPRQYLLRFHVFFSLLVYYCRCPNISCFYSDLVLSTYTHKPARPLTPDTAYFMFILGNWRSYGRTVVPVPCTLAFEKTFDPEIGPG